MNEMNRNAELILQIPISNIVLRNNYTEIFSNEQNIGTLPYLNIAGTTLMYDTDLNNLNLLRWDLVYFKNKEDLDKKVKEIFKDENVIITLGGFRKLYVKNKNESVTMVNCQYKNEEWNIFIE